MVSKIIKSPSQYNTFHHIKSKVHFPPLLSWYKTLNGGLIKIIGLNFVLEVTFHSLLRYNFQVCRTIEFTPVVWSIYVCNRKITLFLLEPSICICINKWWWFNLKKIYILEKCQQNDCSGGNSDYRPIKCRNLVPLGYLFSKSYIFPPPQLVPSI